MSESEILLFHHQDDDYESWVGTHGGYVLTVRTGGEHMLHDSDCSHLGREKPTIRVTEKPRRWAKSRHTLSAWCLAEAGSKPLQCSTCM